MSEKEQKLANMYKSPFRIMFLGSFVEVSERSDFSYFQTILATI